MYLLYLDDSGSASNPQEKYLVLGGVAVFERQAYFLSKQMDELAASISEEDPDSVEFHASHIFGGKTAPWSDFRSKEERKAVIQRVYEKLKYGITGGP